MALSNKIAFITGGNRGLNKDMAFAIAPKSTHAILTYNSQKDKALEVVAAINARAGFSHSFICPNHRRTV